MEEYNAQHVQTSTEWNMLSITPRLAVQGIRHPVTIDPKFDAEKPCLYALVPLSSIRQLQTVTTWIVMESPPFVSTWNSTPLVSLRLKLHVVPTCFVRQNQNHVWVTSGMCSIPLHRCRRIGFNPGERTSIPSAEVEICKKNVEVVPRFWSGFFHTLRNFLSNITSVDTDF